MSSWPATTFLGQLAAETARRRWARNTQAADRGEILLAEGERSDFVAVLLSGIYKVVGLTEDGREALVAVRIGGDIVGEMGLADGGPRSATVRAAGPGECRRVGEGDYRAFLREHPDASLAVTRAMATKLRSATRRRVDFATCPASVRVARVLRELAAAHGVPREPGVLIEVALAQQELAALAGATEPTIQRVFTTMRERGS